MIKEIYKYQFPVFKMEAITTVFTIFVALVLANAIWETTITAGIKAALLPLHYKQNFKKIEVGLPFVCTSKQLI